MEILTFLNNMFYVMYLSTQDEKRPVQMMCQTDTFMFAFVDELPARLLIMPYEGMELSLMVLLPEKGVDLSKVSQENLQHSSV